MNDPAHLRVSAEAEAAQFPPLLARAEHLAGSVLLGEHGRRRAGLGDNFWQYRPAQLGDSRRMIDHRRSARGDIEYVREREWQIAQSVMIWIDRGASMQFHSDDNLPTKGNRARLLGLALSILLVRGGERVGLTGTTLPPRRGNQQILRLAEYLATHDEADYAPPEHRAMIPSARAVFISDFLGPLDEVRLALSKAADRGVRGCMYQVLDPTEEAFPFKGRTIFESMGGTLSHETLKAGDLRDRYLERLAARKAELTELCALAGWQFSTHHTDHSAQAGLLWLYRAMGVSA
ncbi:DUF58 domain-containing protein [Aliishimia ponticola]|uniref:DUF58 domain-containing protein n=1 Tax=Aliishimia ponticola TaxID=2499833 RepID=A0A4S4N6Q3_9RHOB|nr:DUF58 domain-containing protein [Aliishimia ponticola]THH34826.1 DUF58 domain-containing protein [Aliishimia ponticola]